MRQAVRVAVENGWRPGVVIRDGYPASAALVARFGGQPRRSFTVSGQRLLPFVIPPAAGA